jgi:small-conductance mechanosensitive channel
MDNNTQDNRYEQLYSDLTDYTHKLHDTNKKRIKYGVIVVLILPILLYFMRLSTGSDKVLFLLIWVLCTILVSVYLIAVEYLDYSIQNRVRVMTNSEEDFDNLYPTGDDITGKVKEKAGDLSGKVKARIGGLRESSDEQTGWPEEGGDE